MGKFRIAGKPYESDNIARGNTLPDPHREAAPQQVAVLCFPSIAMIYPNGIASFFPSECTITSDRNIDISLTITGPRDFSGCRRKYGHPVLHGNMISYPEISAGMPAVGKHPAGVIRIAATSSRSVIKIVLDETVSAEETSDGEVEGWRSASGVPRQRNHDAQREYQTVKVPT
jgi:hypothetical protein